MLPFHGAKERWAAGDLTKAAFHPPLTDDAQLRSTDGQSSSRGVRVRFFGSQIPFRNNQTQICPSWLPIVSTVGSVIIAHFSINSLISVPFFFPISLLVILPVHPFLFVRRSHHKILEALSAFRARDPQDLWGFCLEITSFRLLHEQEYECRSVQVSFLFIKDHHIAAARCLKFLLSSQPSFWILNRNSPDVLLVNGKMCYNNGPIQWSSPLTFDCCLPTNQLN